MSQKQTIEIEFLSPLPIVNIISKGLVRNLFALPDAESQPCTTVTNRVSFFTHHRGRFPLQKMGFH